MGLTSEQTVPPSVTSKIQSVSPDFERFTVFLICAFACYRLIPSLLAPDWKHIPDQILLAVILFLVGYLWVRRSQALHGLVAAQQSLQDSQLGAIGALVEALEAKDDCTRGHSERVRRLAVELAKEVELDADRVGVVARSAMLHDLGKVGVPDAILRKSGPLSNEERAIFDRHPRSSGEILAALGFLHRESRVCLFHHEKYDGTGYCAGLARDEIPLESSIISVVDSFDAMNSARPYRNRMAKDRILDELEKSRGTQHPPAVVDAFLALLAKRPELWVQ